MRYIVRQIGKYEPIFDRDIGDECMYIEKNIDIGYISNETDDGKAIIINLYSVQDIYVKIEPILSDVGNIFTLTKI